MRRLGALLALAVGLTLQATPAVAESPAIGVPLYRPATAGAGDAVVQLEAPGRAWGIRRTARELDDQVDGLTILTSGTCSSRPDAACVRVELGAYDRAVQATLAAGETYEWSGLTTYPSPSRRVIYLNRRYPRPPNDRAGIAAHELGHALGLAHHWSARGIVSERRHSTTASAGELTALRAWYAGTHVRDTW